MIRLASGRYASYWNAVLLPPANEVCEGYVFTGVCPSTGGVSALLHAGIHSPPPPREQTPPGEDTPRSRHPCSACWEIRSTSGRHASYWNAYLLVVIILHVTSETLRKNKGNLRCMATVKIDGFNSMFDFYIEGGLYLAGFTWQNFKNIQKLDGSIATSNNETKWKLSRRTKNTKQTEKQEYILRKLFGSSWKWKLLLSTL